MVIVEDTRQQAEKHKIKNEYFENHNIKVIRSKLPIGDYARIDNMSVVIDTKKDIQEIIQNVTKDHKRFVAECELAKESGIQLIILIENKDNVEKKEDLFKWYNWRLKKSPKATTGKTLYKILNTMEEEYKVLFQFCTPEKSPEIIEEILSKLG